MPVSDPTEESAEETVEETAVRLFGDPLRIRIVRLLAAEQMCTCHLIDETGARQPTISHHLRILREAGFVETEAHGRFTYYRLRSEPLRTLSDALAGLAESAESAQGRRRAC